MNKYIKGSITDACDKKFAIVVSKFNETITDQLLKGAHQGFTKYGCNSQNIVTVEVPGAFEIPLAVKKILKHQSFDAILCLGCIIRGETPHFEYIAGFTSSSIGSLSVEFETPIIFSVLTTNNMDEAFMRSGIKGPNAGFNGAITAIEMASLSEQLNINLLAQ